MQEVCVLHDVNDDEPNQPPAVPDNQEVEVLENQEVEVLENQDPDCNICVTSPPTVVCAIFPETCINDKASDRRYPDVSWILLYGVVYVMGIGIFNVLPAATVGIGIPIYVNLAFAHVHIACVLGVHHKIFPKWLLLIATYCTLTCGLVLSSLRVLDSGPCVGLFGMMYSCEVCVRTYTRKDMNRKEWTSNTMTCMWRVVYAFVAIVKVTRAYSTLLVSMTLLTSSPESVGGHGMMGIGATVGVLSILVDCPLTTVPPQNSQLLYDCFAFASNVTMLILLFVVLSSTTVSTTLLYVSGTLIFACSTWTQLVIITKVRKVDFENPLATTLPTWIPLHAAIEEHWKVNRLNIRYLLDFNPGDMWLRLERWECVDVVLLHSDNVHRVFCWPHYGYHT
eukprot:PhF_6_TR23805/c0_g1_i2/m.33333